MKKELSVYVLSLLMLAGCSSVPLTGRKQLLLVSDQEVLSSSLTQYKDYIKSAQKSTNATQTAMVLRVGKNIATATERYLRSNGLSAEIKDFSWEFNLVKSDEINAFCMPGGKIVVYEGLMKLVSSDDELAVVLGHEVAHAVAQQRAHQPADACPIRSATSGRKSLTKERDGTSHRQYGVRCGSAIRSNPSFLTQARDGSGLHGTDSDDHGGL
mgnify:CR=1 FL=1